ncbi:MAG: DUF2911 domain-containing protein [Gemmatimonadota bacterium]|mgnify:CR=1 FL=1
MQSRLSHVFAAALVAITAPTARAQGATIVYRLGKDTAAIEHFSRTATKLTGEMVQRTGGVVFRLQYDFTLDKGRPTAAVIRRRQADGTAFPNQPTEWRLAFRADSAVREVVWADSTQRRAFAAPNAFPAPVTYVYGPMELLAAMGKGKRDSVPAIGVAGNNVGYVGLETLDAALRIRSGSGAYPMLLTLDKDGRVQTVDGSFTTNKLLGTRVAGKADIAAIAKTMKPTGALSPRQTAYAAFQQGPIFISYASPAARGRSVWGGTLIPFDTIWRTGANEATHLATSKTIQLGDMTLAPGLYTLWTQHTRTGTFLIVNKQVGQWGTNYSASSDVGRVAMEVANTPEHIEEFTITIRPLPQGRGAIEMAWGDKVATATFTLRQ